MVNCEQFIFQSFIALIILFLMCSIKAITGAFLISPIHVFQLSVILFIVWSYLINLSQSLKCININILYIFHYCSENIFIWCSNNTSIMIPQLSFKENLTLRNLTFRFVKTCLIQNLWCNPPNSKFNDFCPSVIKVSFFE